MKKSSSLKSTESIICSTSSKLVSPYTWGNIEILKYSKMKKLRWNLESSTVNTNDSTEQKYVLCHVVQWQNSQNYKMLTFIEKPVPMNLIRFFVLLEKINEMKWKWNSKKSNLWRERRVWVQFLGFCYCSIVAHLDYVFEQATRRPSPQLFRFRGTFPQLQQTIHRSVVLIAHFFHTVVTWKWNLYFWTDEDTQVLVLVVCRELQVRKLVFSGSEPGQSGFKLEPLTIRPMATHLFKQ